MGSNFSKLEITLTAVLAFLLASTCWILLYGQSQATGPDVTFGALLSLAAVGISIVSLLAGVHTARVGWNLGTIQPTLEAWSKWSDSTYKSRRLVGRTFGTYRINTDQGSQLVAGEAVLVGLSEPLSEKERKEVIRAASRILNGLERIAVGVEYGSLDFKTLHAIGGKIITQTYDRHRSYIEARRTSPDPARRQDTAFTALEELVLRIEKEHSSRRRPGRKRYKVKISKVQG